MWLKKGKWHWWGSSFKNQPVSSQEQGTVICDPSPSCFSHGSDHSLLSLTVSPLPLLSSQKQVIYGVPPWTRPFYFLVYTTFLIFCFRCHVIWSVPYPTQNLLSSKPLCLLNMIKFNVFLNSTWSKLNSLFSSPSSVVSSSLLPSVCFLQQHRHPLSCPRQMAGPPHPVRHHGFQLSVLITLLLIWGILHPTFTS